MQYLDKNRLTRQDYVQGLLAGDTMVLGKALSLMESHLETDQITGLEVLEDIHPNTGKSLRMAITGAPGVGKSTFIETFGLSLLEKGHQVAVLTIDPTSQRTKGSILGDKTRMSRLSKSKNAFIRPSAAGSVLGGVAAHIRESILVCEAAGYDVVIVETVGVGQSETSVRHMVDFFLLLMIAGAGDELQGIKKGIMEMADALVITKADGNNIEPSLQARSIYEGAIHLLSKANNNWDPPVLTCSAHNNEGIDEIWDSISSFENLMKENGYWGDQRKEQLKMWVHECVRQQIEIKVARAKNGANDLDRLLRQVTEGKLLPARAAQLLIDQIT